MILSFVSGAAVALYCAMHYEKPLAGCIALSTMMPEKQLPDPASIVNKDIPYFQAHGETDNILPLSHGLTTSKIFSSRFPSSEANVRSVLLRAGPSLSSSKPRLVT